MADSKVLKWYEELQPVELPVETTAPTPKDMANGTMQGETVDDDDMEYWAAFDDDDARGLI